MLNIFVIPKVAHYCLGSSPLFLIPTHDSAKDSRVENVTPWILARFRIRLYLGEKHFQALRRESPRWT